MVSSYQYTDKFNNLYMEVRSMSLRSLRVVLSMISYFNFEFVYVVCQ